MLNKTRKPSNNFHLGFWNSSGHKIALAAACVPRGTSTQAATEATRKEASGTEAPSMIPAKPLHILHHMLLMRLR
uniref:Uncharacterized protein n=1 Tax=Arundo donax TaxID=35708 RepID=A0A0A9AID3_ARUDO